MAPSPTVSRARLALCVGLLGALMAALLAGEPAGAAFPGDNGRIAFTSNRDGNFEIYSVNPDGSGETNLTNNPAFDSAPAWSPDGTQIVFQSNRDGNTEIYVMDDDGANQTRITDNAASDANPAWSPDGTQIVFQSNRDGSFEIYVMDANGANQTRLTETNNFNGLPAWSPDGSRIAFQTQREADPNNSEIYVIDPDGGNPTNLTNNPARDSQASWSPDGTQIVFNSNRQFVGNEVSDFKIYVMDADGTDPTRLTGPGEGDDVDPAWSPDGTRITFESDRDGNDEIYVMDVDGSNQTNITDNTAFDGQPDWQTINPGPLPTTTTGVSTSTSMPTGDGPPVIEGVQPGTSATAGGVPIRIYGEGFEGTTEVLFGTLAALDFTVVDGNLITAVVPPAPNGAAADNTSVNVVVTDDLGTDIGRNGDGEQLGLYYSNATASVTPDTGLEYGDIPTVSLRGYIANRTAVLALLNPLIAFIEDVEDNTFDGLPPYITLAGFHPTDAMGNVDVTDQEIDDSGFDPDIDVNAVCPPNQITADYGLPRCLFEFTQIAVGPIPAYFSFADNLTPAAPTLTLAPTTAAVGDTVDLSGINWNAAPQFGSDTTPDDPGETQLTVELCNQDLTTCSSASADAMVELVRYRDSDPVQEGVQGVFSGATLSGSFTAGDASCAPDCVVRVSQQRFDVLSGMAIDEFIVATADLTVSGGGGGTTTSTSTSTTSTSTTSTSTTSTSTTSTSTTSTSTTSTTLPPTSTTTSTTTTSTTLPPTTTTTSTTSTSTTSTSTTLPPTTTTSSTVPPTTSTSTTTPPDDDLVVTIDDTVVTDGSRGQVRGTVTCEAGALFMVELDLTQGDSNAQGTARGFCSGSPQNFVIGFATTGSSFSAGDADACVAARTGQLGSRTISDSTEVCEQVMIDLRSR